LGLRILRSFCRLAALSAVAAGAASSPTAAHAAEADDVACAGEACGALSLAMEAGCLEIRNTDETHIVVTFAAGEGAKAERGVILLRPFGRERAALAKGCAGARDDGASVSLETRHAEPPRARPTAKCEGEACADIALSHDGQCLWARNLGNGTVAFQSVEAASRETLLEPYASVTVIAEGGGCVAAKASEVGAVTASYPTGARGRGTQRSSRAAGARHAPCSPGARSRAA
jgi:hypothetical protein